MLIKRTNTLLNIHSDYKCHVTWADHIPEPLGGVSHTRLSQPVTEDDTEQIPALPSFSNFAPVPVIYTYTSNIWLKAKKWIGGKGCNSKWLYLFKFSCSVLSTALNLCAYNKTISARLAFLLHWRETEQKRFNVQLMLYCVTNKHYTAKTG